MSNNNLKFSNQLQCETTTTVKAEMEKGEFPHDESPCYLMERAAFSLLFPQISIGEIKTQYLKQNVMSRIIRLEEKNADFFWDYKAEVVFAMFLDDNQVPVPILSRGGEINRPRSTSYWASISKARKARFGVRGYRRPDIILVEKKEILWPGRKAHYFEGPEYPDNLKMLIEIKFKGDTLKEDQERDYGLIATKDRFGVMRIDEEKGKRHTQEYAGQKEALLEKFKDFWKEMGGLPLPPIGAQPPDDHPTPEPIRAKKQDTGLFDRVLNSVHFPLLDIRNTPLIKQTPWVGKLPEWQLWTIMTEKTVESLASHEWQKNMLHDISQIAQVLAMPFVYQQKIGQTLSEMGLLHERYTIDSQPNKSWFFLSDELVADFKALGAFFIDAGQWVCDALIDPKTQAIMHMTFYYIVAETQEIFAITEKEINKYAEQVYRYTDFTLDDIKMFIFIQVSMQVQYGPAGTVVLELKKQGWEGVQSIVLPTLAAIALITLAILFALPEAVVGAILGLGALTELAVS